MYKLFSSIFNNKISRYFLTLCADNYASNFLSLFLGGWGVGGGHMEFILGFFFSYFAPLFPLEKLSDMSGIGYPGKRNWLWSISYPLGHSVCAILG